MQTILVFIKERSRFISLAVAIIISILVIYQSISLRWIGYEKIPTPITDEFNYAWQALSLREYGVPVAWVTFTDIYNNPNHPFKGADLKGFGLTINKQRVDLKSFKENSIPLVAVAEIDYMKGKEHVFFAAPFFDHPPLGGLIYSLGVNSNIKDFELVKPDSFRKPALVLATITAILLFVFLYQITSNPWVSSLGVIIYSTVPTYLLATRSAFLENALSPFILLHLISLIFCIELSKKNQSRKILPIALFITGIIGGLSILVKEPAFGFLVGSIILLKLNKFSYRNI